MDFDKDVYSVFDRKGHNFLPIPDLGEVRYRETLHFMDVLNKNGVPNHFVRDLGNKKIEIMLARSLGYNEIIPGETIIYLIPAEFVFSKYVTPVASLHKDLREKKVDPREFGLPEDYVPTKDEIVTLPQPRVRISTKIEAADVYRRDVEFSGLVGNEKSRAENLTLDICEMVGEDAKQTGLQIADGKFEYVMGNGRNIIVGDAFSGDEPRILYDDVDISKQMQRNYYILIGYKATVDKAKHDQLPKDQWPNPPPMHQDFIRLVSEISKARCVAWTRKKWGNDEEPHSLDVLVPRLREWYDRLYNEHGIELC
jgi:phosphoribosylaminoimidazole-succinocarboxamide synthase